MQDPVSAHPSGITESPCEIDARMQNLGFINSSTRELDSDKAVSLTVKKVLLPELEKLPPTSSQKSRPQSDKTVKTPYVQMADDFLKGSVEGAIKFGEQRKQVEPLLIHESDCMFDFKSNAVELAFSDDGRD